MNESERLEWLEGARDNFDVALSEGNVDLAKDIITDVIFNNFLLEGRSMQLQMRKAYNRAE